MEAKTQLKPCKCDHPYQDAKYGKGKRLHNRVDKSANPTKWRCTVCGDVK